MKPAFQKDEALLADIARARASIQCSVFSVQSALHDARARLWWLGQSGFLLHTRGGTVLFDPYLSDSLTNKYAATDKPHVRVTEQVIAPERLTGIDVITSSHNHTDHLDAETLLPLLAANPQARLVIPRANRAFVLERLGKVGAAAHEPVARHAGFSRQHPGTPNALPPEGGVPIARCMGPMHDTEIVEPPQEPSEPPHGPGGRQSSATLEIGDGPKRQRAGALQDADALHANPARECDPPVPCANLHLADALVEVDAGESVTVAGVEFHGIAAAHNTVERDEQGRCRFLGYVARVGGLTIFHSGDTLMHDGLIPALKPFRVDVALLPINGNRPERRVAGNLNGREAAALAHAIGARLAVPHHFVRFSLSLRQAASERARCSRTSPGMP